MAKDVVCGMEVKESGAREENLVSQFEGKDFFFCSKACKAEFEQNPEQFARSSLGMVGGARKGMAKQTKPADAQKPAGKAQPQKGKQKT